MELVQVGQRFLRLYVPDIKVDTLSLALRSLLASSDQLPVWMEGHADDILVVILEENCVGTNDVSRFDTFRVAGSARI